MHSLYKLSFPSPHDHTPLYSPMPHPLSRERDYTVEFDYFLRGKESMRMDVRVPQIEGLTKDQVRMVIAVYVPLSE